MPTKSVRKAHILRMHNDQLYAWIDVQVFWSDGTVEIKEYVLTHKEVLYAMMDLVRGQPNA